MDRIVSSEDRIVSSESVSEGHPDKVCDAVSDAVLDLYLTRDPAARVAAETAVTTNRLILFGEVGSRVRVEAEEIEQVIRDLIRGIGYEQEGFHWQTVVIENLLHEQSADIARGVDSNDGAGDQGIMFGFACRETEALMPAPVFHAHRILRDLAAFRRSGAHGLGPDAKSQISVRYRDGRPVGTERIVLSCQHEEHLSTDDVRALVLPVIAGALPEGWMCPPEAVLVNPTGKFVIGGPDGDAGLTGRKIIVDTYGGAAPHGGGAFSGKDPSKVDRSASYATRSIAKTVVAAGLAERCLIQVSYAIGIAEPLSIYVDTSGTGAVPDRELESTIRRLWDLTPRGIRTHLGLCQPIYRPTASYGHFGREPTEDGRFSWERTPLVDALRDALPHAVGHDGSRRATG